MQITTSQSPDGLVLHGDGEFTLRHITDVRRAFVDALNTADRIRLDLQKVTEIDVSCLQLLCSAHRTSVKHGKLFAFTWEAPASLKSTIEKAGFRRHKGCALDADNTCIWKEVPHGE